MRGVWDNNLYNLGLVYLRRLPAPEVARPNPHILLAGALPRRYGASAFLVLCLKRSENVVLYASTVRLTHEVTAHRHECLNSYSMNLSKYNYKKVSRAKTPRAQTKILSF